LVDPHPYEPLRRPERVDVALAVADRPVARMEPAPVVPPVLIRAVERLEVPRIQVDAVDLHERTLDLAGDVRDRARRAEGPLERNPTRVASRVAPRPVGLIRGPRHGLPGVRGSQDVLDRDPFRRTFDF